MNKLQNPDHQKYLSEANSFVERNIVDAKDGRQCVDGRYENKGNESGFIARAGGDFGYVMGLLKLSRDGIISFTPQEAFDKVYDAVTADGGKFYAHTDSAAIEKGKKTGCGHAARSLEEKYQELYGIDPKDVDEVIEYMRDEKAHPNVEEVELPGDHEEKGVLLVRGMNRTIDHKGEQGMYFVYDIDRDEELQRKLVEKMNIERLTEDKFREALEQQTNATVGLLAPEKPIIEVDLREEKPKLIFVALVPPLAA